MSSTNGWTSFSRIFSSSRSLVQGSLEVNLRAMREQEQKPSWGEAKTPTRTSLSCILFTKWHHGAGHSRAWEVDSVGGAADYMVKDQDPGTEGLVHSTLQPVWMLSRWTWPVALGTVLRMSMHLEKITWFSRFLDSFVSVMSELQSGK